MFSKAKWQIIDKKITHSSKAKKSSKYLYCNSLLTLKHAKQKEMPLFIWT